MAENHDNNEIEYMTNNEDISYPEDIDVIFNEDDDDNVKLIIPDYSDMKDFENNSKDDYISDDDLDFVDSVDSASASDLDVIFNEEDENDSEDFEIHEESAEVKQEETDKNEEELVIEPEVTEKNQELPEESEEEENHIVLNFDEFENINPDEEKSLQDTEIKTEEEEEEDEILNLDEEPSELQDVIVIEQETKNEDIEIISPQQSVEEVIPPVSEPEPEPAISLEEPNDIFLQEEEPKKEDDIIILSEPVIEEPVAQEAVVEEQVAEEPIVEEPVQTEKEEEIFVETKVETELVDNALNALNNSSDFEIIEESGQNDIPLKIDSVQSEENNQEVILSDIEEEEPHNFTISDEPEVVPLEVVAEGKQEEEQEQPKSEEEEFLEENVFAVCNIDETRGFYFAKNEQTVALFGYINDEIFLLKDFPELYDKSLGVRLEERKFYSESYLVRVNSQKFLVEVDETSMKIAMEL